MLEDMELLRCSWRALFGSLIGLRGGVAAFARHAEINCPGKDQNPVGVCTPPPGAKKTVGVRTKSPLTGDKLFYSLAFREVTVIN